MLFRIMFAAVALSLSLSASASEAYNRVREMFAEGTTFDFTAKLGWYSGRCFSPQSESAVGVVAVLDSRSANGPAFPGINKFLFFTGPAGRPDFYDNMTDPERLSISATFERLWPSIVPSQDTSAHTIFYSTVMHSLRMSSDGLFLVGQATSLVDSNTLACYFFKRVQ